jgi:D-alanyl-D-alanine carboxypeptidase
VAPRLAGWSAIAGVTASLLIACGGHSPSATHGGVQPHGDDAAARAQLQATLDRVRRQQQIPGAEAAVVFPDGRLWAGESGLADLRTRHPVRPDTLFAIGSVTKTFIAALVLSLAQDGKLSLDDRLSRWVPSFPDSRHITLRQLLNHTSGTSDFVRDGAFQAAERRRGAGAVWTPQLTLRYAPEALAKPGERWIYSNTNYVLLGLVIERATHSTVARQLHRRLLPRATFDRMLLQGDERPRGAVAVGYMQRDADPELDPSANNPYVPSTAEATVAWASGGMLANATDLARAGDALFRGRDLDAASLRAMTRWVKALVPPEYGLGLEHDRIAGAEVWGHSGDIYGFHADLWYLPRLGVTVAALGNYLPGDFEEHRELAAALIAEVRKDVH